MTPAKGYMEMKDSGIEWVGMIPAHWGICKIKYTVTQETLRAENNGGYIGLENVESWSGKIIDKHNENVVVEGASLAVCPNDILFGKLRPYLAKCAIAEKSGCCSTEFIVMRPHSIEGRFLKYVMLTPQFIDMVNMSTYGAKMPRANWDFIGNALLAMPSRDEQAAIASYLDTQCAKIDEIIAQAKASIEDYKQWKASIIYEAVTKGLNPNVEMKDSGVHWIGNMPINWYLKKAKYCVSITNGSDPKSEGTVPVYGSGAESFKTCGEYKEGPAVLIGRKGATLHIPHYIEGRYWNVDTAFDVKPCEGFSLRYYYYLACIFDYNYYISQTTLPGMTQTNYNNMKLPCPSLDGQSAITSYLDTQCAKIDELTSEKQSLIDDLESYKKSLIYEVVTGKRKA